MNEILKNLVDNNLIQIFGGITIVFIAAMTAFLANRHIAVFNDGVRPLVGQRKQGNLKYKALASMSFAMSIGYVIGFIPFSLAQNILIMHTVLLGSEMIGLIFKNNKKNSLIAGILASAYGAFIYWGLNYLNKGISHITYPGFGFDLGQIVDGAFPFIFSMFPAISLFIQSGWKKGTFGILISIVTYILVSLYGWNQNHFYPMAITLLVGTFLLFASSLHDHYKNRKHKKEITKSNPFDMFEKNAKQIIKNKWYFVISGAAAAMAITSFAGSPLVSMALQTSSKQLGNISSALIADTTWVIGFIPLVILTALLTGVYSPVGLTAIFVWGDIAKMIGAAIVKSTGQESMYFIAIGLAGIFGGISLFAETYMLLGISKILVKIPNIQRISDSMRTGITKTINWAFLFGGVLAAYIMGQNVGAAIQGKSVALSGLAFWMPSMGAGIVLTGLIINSLLKRKFAEIAIGPLGAIVVGFIFNIIYFVS